MAFSFQTLPAEIRITIYSYLFPQVCLAARPLDITIHRRMDWDPQSRAYQFSWWTYSTYPRLQGLHQDISTVRNLMLTAQFIRQEVSELFYTSITPVFERVQALTEFTHVTSPFTRSTIRRISVWDTFLSLPEKTKALSMFPNLQHTILIDCPNARGRLGIWYLGGVKAVMESCPQLKHSYYGSDLTVHLSATELVASDMEKFDLEEELGRCRIEMRTETQYSD